MTTRTEFEAAAYRWLPIETAPKDGRPVWVRGANWGDADGGRGFHQCWAWFDSEHWQSAGVEESWLDHLREWMPVAVAMGWPTVPEVSREQLLDAAIERVFSAPTPKEPTP